MHTNAKKRFRIGTTRSLLVGAVLSAQTAVLGLAWWLSLREAVGDVVQLTTERVRSGLEGTAASIAMAINRAEISSLGRGSQDWERAQSMIAGLALPAGAAVSIVGDDGRVLCHPELTTAQPAGQPGPKPWAHGITASAPLPHLNAAVVVTGPSQEVSAAAAIEADVVLKAAFGGIAVLSLTGVVAVALISLHGRKMERLNTELARGITERTDEILRTREAMIFGLAKLADYRDSDTGHHLDRICTFAVELAAASREAHHEIDDNFIDELRLAASLHDIGKVGIPDSVLLKPGVLNNEERAIVERHPEIGATTLEAIRSRSRSDDPLLGMSIQIARHHHERWDGTGYPAKLAGDAIPLAARIVAIADVYDALTSDRIYKTALGHARACEIIAAGKGSQFDPSLVDAFEAVAGRFAEARLRLRPPGARMAA
jgi:HD-GYP domain-containing protein (c-di-GMP phosphodiesterase class II)